MNIHEFQAKEILKKYGVPIPEFAVVSTMAEAEAAVDEMELDSAVVKVQVHAGGRGKAGGVKIADERKEILDYAEQLIGMKVVNNQTGAEGVVAHQVMISQVETIKEQYYVGCIIDRAQARPTVIVSPEGGVEIEQVAAQSPDRILTMPIGLDGKLRRYQLMNIAKFMGWTGDIAKQGMQVVAALALAFTDTDASLLEINPLVLTDDDRICALDAKLSVDGSALFRQEEIAGFYDPSQLPAREAAAKEHDLAYIVLDGDIGCMVNGAGLAMATMDIIDYYGGAPANFLDVGGSASQEKVAEGFKIILSDEKVKAILVNIFGGIMNCVTIAAGIIAAVGQMELRVPLVVRLEGTNVEPAKRMVEDSCLNIIIADSMAEAGEKVVKASKGIPPGS